MSEKKISAESDWASNSLPLIIGEERITEVLNKEPVHRLAVTSLLGYKQVYHSLEKATTGTVQYYFFLTCKVASYKDCLIWYASTNNENLVQVEMLARYKKTLTYSIIPVVWVDSSSIMVDIQRIVKYPLSVLNSYTLYYNIMANGQLFRSGHN